MKTSSGDRSKRGRHMPPKPATQLSDDLAKASHHERSDDAGPHELRLYQLELEMQNESLRQAQTALAESRARYSDLFEFAPVGYLTLSEQGKIAAINLAGAELLGGERATLVGKSFAGFVAAADADRWHLHLVCVLKQHDKQELEITLARKDSAILSVRVNSRRSVQDGQVPTVQLVLTDITTLKQAEFEMQQAQQYANIGSWYWDAKTGDQEMSREMTQIFGRERIPPFPEQRGVLYPAETWERLNAAVQEAAGSGIGYNLELPALRGDGTPLWINTRCNVVRHADGEICGLRGTVQDITHSRRAEEQIRFQARLLNAIGQAVIATDAGGMITYMNVAAEDLYGWKADAAVGRSILDVTVPDVSLGQASEIMRQLMAGRPRSGEFAVRHRDGRVFEAEVHDTPIMDGSGKLIGVIGVSSDITSLKAAEDVQRGTAAYARSLLEASLDPLVTISADGKITDVNEASVQATGVPRSQLVGTDFSNYFTDPDEARAGYRKVFSDGFVRDYPLAVRHTSGRIIDVLYNASVYRDGGGNVLGVFAAARDVTLQKQASQYARSLLEASLDPLVTISADGKITDVNEASVQATGVPRSQLVGTDFSDYFTDPDEARAGYRKVFSDGFVRDYPLAVRHTSGRIIDVLYNASVYKDGGGNVLGVFAAARDVTERKRIDETLHETNLELKGARFAAEKANLAKSEFLSSMSHELRSPLNAILGFAQLLESDSQIPTPSQKDSIDHILRAGWYLLELINEILDLALIESGKLALLPEPVSLADVFSDCLAMIEIQAQTAGIRVSLSEFAHPYIVRADRTRLKQVVVNLLSNAIKYNRVGGRVEVICDASAAPRTRVSIRDTGHGLSAEQLAELFQPFNRLGQEGGGVEGTGIGLMVCKRLVELMGGEIGAQSTVGVGSVFWFELNTVAETRFADESAAPIAATTAENRAAARLRTVLYVEDNPANLKLVQKLLARRPDICLLSASDGHRGIEIARAELPDAILMDINLPGISGIEAKKVLADNPTTARIPVIALSANAMPSDIERGIEAGFFAYLTKPIKIKEFMDTLDAVLESAHGESAGSGEEEEVRRSTRTGQPR